MKRSSTLIAVVAAILSALCLFGLIIAFFQVQSELNSGYELSRMESLSPYGDPETSEEIEANVKEEFANSNIFLRIASGNTDVSKKIVLAFLVFVFLASLLKLRANYKAAEAKKEKARQQKIKSDFHQKMEALGY